jgi:hypothetical protein
MPKNRTDLVVQRAVVRHGFSRDMADFPLNDIQRALDYFAKQPGMTPGTGEGSGTIIPNTVGAERTEEAPEPIVSVSIS